MDQLQKTVSQSNKVADCVDLLEIAGNRIVKELRSLKKIVEKHVTDVKVAKTVGNSASILGTVGVLAAPFTFGISAIPAAVVAIAGAATSIGADIGDSIRSSGFKEKVKSALDDFKQEADRVIREIDLLQKLLECPEVGQMIMKYSRDTANIGSKVCQLVLIIGQIKNVHRGFGAVKAVEKGGEVFLASSGKALQAASGVKSSKFLSAGKVSGKFLAGVGIILDTADLVMTWTGEDANVTAIDEAITAIANAIEDLKEYKNKLRQCSIK